jgi:hypothetical protein
MSERGKTIQFPFSHYKMYHSKGRIVKLIYKIAINLLVLGTPSRIFPKYFSIWSQILT